MTEFTMYELNGVAVPDTKLERSLRDCITGIGPGSTRSRSIRLRSFRPVFSGW